MIALTPAPLLASKADQLAAAHLATLAIVADTCDRFTRARCATLAKKVNRYRLWQDAGMLGKNGIGAEIAMMARGVGL